MRQKNKEWVWKFYIFLSVIFLSAIFLSVIFLSVIFLSAIFLSGLVSHLRSLGRNARMIDRTMVQT